MTRAWRWILGVVAGVVALSALALGAWSGVDAVGASVAVPVHEVRRGEFVRRVHAEGNLEAAQATLLGPPPTLRNPMRIAWLAPDGSRVAAGDVVVRFDPTEMEQKLLEGEVEQATTLTRIEQKKVRDESAARNLERDAEIADVELRYAREFQSKDPEIFSRSEIVQSRIDEQLAGERKEHAEEVREIRGDLSQVELDLLGIEQRKAELKIRQARNDLQQLELRAPHAGILSLKEVWGQIPEVGSQIWPGNPVVEIPLPDVMQAKVHVLEADAGGLKVGIPASVVLDAHPEQVYRGRVAQVEALAQRRDRRVPVQYFGVVLELEETDPQRMKPGQRVQATLTLDSRDDVLTVPRQAVFEREGRNVVYVRRGERFEPVAVKLGSTGLGRQVIESGLEEGELVALRDPSRPLAREGETRAAEAPAPSDSRGGR